MFKRLRNFFGASEQQEEELQAEANVEVEAPENELDMAEAEAELDAEAEYTEDDVFVAEDDAVAVADAPETAALADAAQSAAEEEIAADAEPEVEAITYVEAPLELEEDAEALDDEIATQEPVALDEEEVATEEYAEVPTAYGSLADLPVAEMEEIVAEQAEEEPAPVGGIFNPFRMGLQRTRGLFSRMSFNTDEITDDLWDELEETLLEADVGVQLTEKLLNTLRERVKFDGITRGRELREALKEELQILLGEPDPLVFSDTSSISVFLVVGVNGVGKTTSIAKMTNLLKKDNYKVMLAAGDTFRAAAIEQLKTWGDRLKVPVVAHQHGADPAAVVFDAMESAQARKQDVLIVDTAGRLHTKSNLMEELKKIGKVLAKYDPEAPHEVLLVLDATTGQNAILQAKTFVEDSGVSGIILTKLDGTARGGVVFSVSSELGLPIKFIGTGERVNDIAPFDPTSFVDALFEE